MFVVGFDERINVLFELFDGGVRCAGQRLVLIALMGFVTALIWLSHAIDFHIRRTASSNEHKDEVNTLAIMTGVSLTPFV